MQINGLRVDRYVKFIAKEDGNEYEFYFCPYSEFKNAQDKFINPCDIGDCKTVVMYTSMANNSLEIYYIKIFISILYFAYRIRVEEKRKNDYMTNSLYSFMSEEMKNEQYKEKHSYITKNWNVRGFWNTNNIEKIHWCIKLGKNEMSCDDFESYLTRAYDFNLCDSYDNRFIFIPEDAIIDIDNEIVEIINELNRMINMDGVCGYKMKSAMRLYYEMLMIYTNMNMSILTISTILETLLLGEDEDNQRKKVSVRSACLIFDGMNSVWKTTLADTVFYF